MKLPRRLPSLFIAAATLCAFPLHAADKVAVIIPEQSERGWDAIPVSSPLNYLGNPSRRSNSCSIEVYGKVVQSKNCFELPTVGSVATIEKRIVEKQDADRRVVLTLVAELETRIRELESEVAALRELNEVRGTKVN